MRLGSHISPIAYLQTTTSIWYAGADGSLRRHVGKKKRPRRQLKCYPFSLNKVLARPLIYFSQARFVHCKIFIKIIISMIIVIFERIRI